MGKKNPPQAAAVKTLAQVAYEAFFKDDGTARPWGAVLRLPAEVADWERAAAAVINAAAAPTPAQDAPDEPALAWRCFHCDEQFTDADAARLHFGASEYDKPACQVDVVQLRWLEAQLVEHEQLRRRAEEDGYAKGLADAARASQPTPARDAAATVPVEDSQLLDFLAEESLDLRCFSLSDDDVGWRTVQHHHGKPAERVASEVYRDDPRQAIREAMGRLHRDPYCTGPLHEDDGATPPAPQAAPTAAQPVVHDPLRDGAEPVAVEAFHHALAGGHANDLYKLPARCAARRAAQAPALVPLTDAWVAMHLEQRGYITKRGAVYGGSAGPDDTPLYKIKGGIRPPAPQASPTAAGGQ